ncbi:hypothetical protein GCM10007169_11750 [Shewanella fodinae]|nr:hypothetical protein GCM10007169_11750 [Shewanella fodinae]
MTNPDIMSHTAVEPNPENNRSGRITLNTVAKAKNSNPVRNGGRNPELHKTNVTMTIAALRRNVTE